MSQVNPHRKIALAARAKTKVKARGHWAVCTLSADEIEAMAFALDLFLEDYEGALMKGELLLIQPSIKKELERA